MRAKVSSLLPADPIALSLGLGALIVMLAKRQSQPRQYRLWCTRKLDTLETMTNGTFRGARFRRPHC